MPALSTTTTKQRFIYSISQLNNEAKELLEGTFPLVWIEGEISNFSVPTSGHWYFSLKDDKAQARGAMFRMRNMHVGFRPKNGDQVLIRARVSLYAPRGDFQLIAEHMEPAGDGALRRAFDELKAKLDKEGLFASDHKKPLPALPQTIGVVTSPTGAAIRDILTVLKRRHPSARVIIYPVAVQGEKAADEIAEAIELADERSECDVLIVGRGGGSLEDLWSFNEECVARAIYGASLPIVSAVGHEIDYTISDFVADQRAATPSAAAELISPDQSEWLSRLQQQKQRLQRAMESQLKALSQHLSWLRKGVQHPEQKLLNNAQRLDELERRMTTSLQQQHQRLEHRISLLNAQIEQLNPIHTLHRYGLQFKTLSQRLNTGMTVQLRNRQQQLASTSHALDTVSPLATLSRGYAIAENAESHELIRDARQVKVGDSLKIRLGQGSLQSKVTEIQND